MRSRNCLQPPFPEDAENLGMTVFLQKKNPPVASSVSRCLLCALETICLSFYTLLNTDLDPLKKLVLDDECPSPVRMASHYVVPRFGALKTSTSFFPQPDTTIWFPKKKALQHIHVCIFPNVDMIVCCDSAPLHSRNPLHVRLWKTTGCFLESLHLPKTRYFNI
jgi:hypothetical protein